MKLNLQFFGGRGAKSTLANSKGKRAAKEGKTYKLFHGSPNANIESFDIQFAGKNTQSGEKLLFFTDSKEFADDFSYQRLEGSSMLTDKRGEKGRVYEVEVKMNNPLNLQKLSQKDIKNIISMSTDEITESQVKRFSEGNNQLLKAYLDLNKLSNYGYDGLIAKANKTGALEYGVLSNKQVRIRK